MPALFSLFPRNERIVGICLVKASIVVTMCNTIRNPTCAFIVIGMSDSCPYLKPVRIMYEFEF